MKLGGGTWRFKSLIRLSKCELSVKLHLVNSLVCWDVVDLLESSLDLLRHQLLDTPHEYDSNDCQDREGNDACPSKAVRIRVLPVALVQSSGPNAGSGALDAFQLTAL